MRILRFALVRLALVAVTACALTGCFDLDQDVNVGRDGSGRYAFSITMEGAMADALKSSKGDASGNPLAPNKATVATVSKNGKVSKVATAQFKTLSDLTLKNERMSLKVLDGGFFGLTPKHMRFRHSFAVGDARSDRAGLGKKDDEMSQQLLAGIFGNHEYRFSVTLPGSIERVAPLRIAGVEIRPEITGDYWRHTVTWRMPLMRMMMAKDIVTEVDFSALGSFADAQSH